MKIKWLIYITVLMCCVNTAFSQASFTAPDTVCISQNFTITNTTVSATTYNWNFCDAGYSANVSGINLGNIGGNFSVPVFMDYVLDNGNYYGFVFNFNPGGITRLDFGNSLLNTPTAVFLGNPNGVLWSGAGGEDIKLVKQNGNWIAIIVGGSNITGTGPKIVKLDFGTNITNTNPATTDWGNIGTLDQPHQLHLWQENNIWYGILFNAESNTISRINFTNSFNNTPTGVNLGNIGNLNFPSNFDIINDNGNWRMFVTNTKGNSISRLDFGSSLLNTPIGVNLGNPNNVLSWPRGIKIYSKCGEVYGYICNQAGNDISKITFNGNILGTPSGISLGNIGNLSSPISFTKEFHIGNDAYCFIPSDGNNTLVRIKLSGCTNSSIPNSSLQTPPQISYNIAGIYNITLTIDEGLATQSSFCKQVVVKNCPQPFASFIAPDTVCVNQNFSVTNTSSNATTYNWNFCSTNFSSSLTGATIANLTNFISQPAALDYVLDNGNYYAFVVNHLPGGIVRLDFGNSLLNTPTTVNLGNIGGVMNNGGSEGLQLRKQNGKYFLYVVGGTTKNGTTPKLIRFELGANITNVTPIVTDFGNIGNMDQPHQLYMWQENNIWYGLIFNSEDNTITRINFTSDFTNTPTGINLGSFSSFNYPTNFSVVNDNGTYRVFVTNTKGNTVSRLDFGNSLLNTPTDIGLGNISGILNVPRGIIIKKNCDGIYGYLSNAGTNDIVKISLTSYTSIPTGISLGNIGNLSYPTSFSKDFEIGNDSYLFIQNVLNSTIARLKISGCTNASIPNSTLQTPPQISYNTAGTYNITLTIDEDLATQNSFCKQIVVRNCSIPPNPNCQGVVALTKTSKITPPSPIKKYFPNTGFTWECWFNSNYYANNSSTINTRNKIISVLDAPNCQDIVLGFGWPQVAQQNELCFVADGPNGCADRDNTPCKYFPTGGFVANTWYHVAAVRDYANNISNLYVNGILVDTKTNTHGPINPTLLPFFGIGSYTSLIDSAFAGKLDEIRIWNYPRNATQIQTNYDKCLHANETGLVAYYHSNEGKGTSLKDASPNSNDASLSASVTWDKTDNAPLTTTCYQSTYSSITKTICNSDSFQHHTTSGIYTDTIINSYGCDSVTALHLTVLPAASTIKDTLSNCGSVVVNGVTYTSNTIVSTTIKNSLGCDSIIQQHQIIITNKQDTVYKQICSGQAFWGHSSTFDTVFHLANNCDSSLHVSITSSAYLKDSVAKNICLGDTLFGHFASGIYSDTTKTGSCDTIHILNLNIINNLHPQLQQDTSICDGDIINLYPGGFKKYLWNTGSISSSINVKNIGLYWVEVSDSIGCKARDTFILINTYTKPTNFLPNNLQACVGELYTLNGYKNYNWITGETTPSIALNGLNSYWLQVTDNNGCSGLDTMKIIYAGSQNFNIVNAFSPNGDGINDEFKPFSGSCIVQFKMYIFNRWGQKVFETASVNKGWNGIMNSKPLPTDVYYYIINYKTMSGVNETKSGSITLLR